MQFNIYTCSQQIYNDRHVFSSGLYNWPKYFSLCFVIMYSIKLPCGVTFSVTLPICLRDNNDFILHESMFLPNLDDGSFTTRGSSLLGQRVL